MRISPIVDSHFAASGSRVSVFTILRFGCSRWPDFRKEYGATISAQIIEAAGYVILFTTASRERLTAVRCLQGYRLRWQVELQFKRWKSLCNFDCWPNQRDDTILSWLYAKVLLGVLLDRMASIPTEVFPPNALRDSPERRVASDVVRSLESDEHPIPARHSRADASRAA